MRSLARSLGRPLSSDKRSFRYLLAAFFNLQEAIPPTPTSLVFERKSLVVRAMSSRADRSDARLPPDEEARRAAEAKEYFDGIAPQRHTKPSRSDYSAIYSDAVGPATDGHDSIPEFDRFRDLEADPQKLVCDGSEVVEEYVETEYYTDLNCVDKQHHTTGTGFIKMEQSNGSSFHGDQVSGASCCHESCKGNPATNEWIPSADPVITVSDKPNRSDV